MKRFAAALIVVAAIVGGAVLVAAGPASAHPLGNFTVNVYSGLVVGADRVDVQVVVDMAEIPAFQASSEVKLLGASYAPKTCTSALAQAQLWVDGNAVGLGLASSAVTFPPGAGGLDTLRLTCSLRAEVGGASGARDLRFRNRLYDDRVGWREITAIGDGATLVSSDVPTSSVSAGLTAYPDDLLSSPLRQTEATLRARPGGGTGPGGALLPALTGRAAGATDRYTALVARDLTVGAGVLAFLFAIVLGAAHSLAPGHGKTLMAAYLVGERGSVRQAALVGLTVTATHTAGVILLGIAVSVFTGFAPERLYPWFGIVSGVLVGVIGTGLLRRAWDRRRVPALAGVHDHASDHPHAHAHPHAHDHPHPHAHEHPHPHPHRQEEAELPRRRLMAMGLAGGLVPTPSAVLVLLAATGLGRAWFGVVLVVAYGLGMAVTLTAAGFALVRARGALERRLRPGARLDVAARLLPVGTAAIVIATGVVLAARGANQL